MKENKHSRGKCEAEIWEEWNPIMHCIVKFDVVNE